MCFLAEYKMIVYDLYYLLIRCHVNCHRIFARKLAKNYQKLDFCLFVKFNVSWIN